MDVLGDKPGQHHRRCWSLGNAPCHVEHGHDSGSVCYLLVRPRLWLWLISTDSLREISGPWLCQLLRTQPNHIPQCICHFRHGHCHQVLRCRHQLPNHYWRSHARCCARVWRSWERDISGGQAFLGYRVHVSILRGRLPRHC
jgi:hypothetical protein